MAATLHSGGNGEPSSGITPDNTVRSISSSVARPAYQQRDSAASTQPPAPAKSPSICSRRLTLPPTEAAEGRGERRGLESAGVAAAEEEGEQEDGLPEIF